MIELDRITGQNEGQGTQARLAALYCVGELLHRSGTSLPPLAEIAKELLGALGDAVFIDLLVEGGGVKRAAWAHGDEAVQRQYDAFWPQVEVTHYSHHPIAMAVSAGQPLFAPDVDDTWLRNMATNEEHFVLMKRAGFQSIVVAPMSVDGTPMGAVTACFTHKSGRRHTRADLDLTMEIARRLSDAIARQRQADKLNSLLGDIESEVAGRVRQRERFWTICGELMSIAGSDGYLKAVNPAWIKALGHDEATLLSTPFMEFTNPVHREQSEAVMARLAEGELIVRYDGQMRRADGTYAWIAWTVVPDGDQYYAVGWDITEERKREEELRREKGNLSEAQRLANFGSWKWHAATGKVEWSDQLCEIFGVEPDHPERAIEDFLNRVAPEDRPRVESEFAKAVAEGRGFKSRERIVRPGGDVRYLQSSAEPVMDEKGNLIQMQGICLDVTEFHLAQEALQSSEERYRLLVQSVQDYAIYMLDPTGNIISWNPGAERIKQYPAEEIIGQNYSRFFTDEDREKDMPMRALRIAAEVGKYEGEGWRVRRDGSRLFANVVVDAIRDPGGKLLGFAKITKDITERRRTQEELEQAREKLSQALRLEAVGQLTGGIAHDFNNLLQVISGYTQLMRARAGVDARSEKALNAIAQATAHGVSLTRQLLTFSRRQTLNTEVVRLPDRFVSLRSVLSSSLRGDIVLNLDIPTDIWPVEVDLSEFELALLNLAVNARDAMPRGGDLHISAANRVLAGTETLEGLKGEYIAIAVRDTGSGMDADVLSRVFEPFYTTKPVGQGTGLGLSQVYGFSRQSGGGVTIESKPGAGTTVTIFLPRTEKDAVSSAVAEKPPEANAAAHSGTALLVEDNREVAGVTIAMLEQLGFKTHHVEDAETALRVLQSQPNIAILITDVVMPGAMNGLELARRVSREAHGLPILLISGYNTVQSTEISEFPVLRKPFDLSTLRTTLETLLQPAAARAS